VADLQFLTLDDVAEILATTRSQVYALVRNKQLRAVKIGGRGQWRVGRADLDHYVARLYAETDAWIDAHPFSGDEDDEVS
jgi:excisionase family DNA binding protein